VRHVLRVIRETLYFKPEGRATDINAALEYLNKVATRRTVTFLISDFLAPDFKKILAISNKRHDIVAITVTDPREAELPPVGLLKIYDPETGGSGLVDTSDPQVRRDFAAAAEARRRSRGQVFGSAGVDAVDVRTDVPYARSLIQFFRAREKRRR
jgi:uncharacterized protein (DUF58 family)